MKRLRLLIPSIQRLVEDLPSSGRHESVIAGAGRLCHYLVLNLLKTGEKPEWAHLAFGTG